MSPRPPEGASPRARRFWRDCHAKYDFDRPDELQLLTEAVRTLTAVDELQEVLAADGPLSVGSKLQPVEHPAGPALRAHRLVLARLLRQLNLPDLEAAQTEPDHPAWSQQRRAAQTRWAAKKGARGGQG